MTEQEQTFSFHFAMSAYHKVHVVRNNTSLQVAMTNIKVINAIYEVINSKHC